MQERGNFKELDLSDGHSTGIPTIQDELKKNGSPRAEFFTDEDRRATRIRIPIHPAFLTDNDIDVGVTKKAPNKEILDAMVPTLNKMM